MKPAVKPELFRELAPRPRPPLTPAKSVLRPVTLPTLTSRWRLLVVTDDRARLATWQAALSETQWEITGLTVSAWLNREAERTYDLALVDVSVDQLAAVLVTLRGTDWQMPILVEASRLPQDLSYAGILPHYRAFPGTQAELLRLMEKRWLPVNAAPRTRCLL